MTEYSEWLANQIHQNWVTLDDQDQVQEHRIDGHCQSYGKDMVGVHVLCFLRDQLWHGTIATTHHKSQHRKFHDIHIVDEGDVDLEDHKIEPI